MFRDATGSAPAWVQLINSTFDPNTAPMSEEDQEAMVALQQDGAKLTANSSSELSCHSLDCNYELYLFISYK